MMPETAVRWANEEADLRYSSSTADVAIFLYAGGWLMYDRRVAELNPSGTRFVC